MPNLRTQTGLAEELAAFHLMEKMRLEMGIVDCFTTEADIQTAVTWPPKLGQFDTQHMEREIARGI